MRDGYITIKSGSDGAATATSVPGVVRRGATSPITCIAKRSLPPDPDAWRRSMRTNISTSITDIDPAAWDALEAGGSLPAPCVSRRARVDLVRRREIRLAAHAHNAAATNTDSRPRVPAYERRIPLASSSSIFPGRRRTRSMASTITPSSWSACLHTGGRRTPAGAPDLDASVMRARLIAALREFAEARGFSSIHALFVDADDRAPRSAPTAGSRVATCSFTGTITVIATSNTISKVPPRRSAKKRGASGRRVAEDGITFETLLGADLDRKSIDEVYDLHRDTFLRHGHEPDLSRAMFRALPRALGERFMVKTCARRRRHRGSGGLLLESGGAVRSLLGRVRGSPQPAFRNLLSPGNRVLHRARHWALRARHAGRTQG